MINYSGDIGVSGSISASNGDRAVISGDIGVDLSLTYNGSQTGTGTETLSGELSAVIYYHGGGSNRYTLPFGPVSGSVQVQNGAVTITPTVVSAGAIVITVSGSGTIAGNLTQMTETVTAMGSGSYQGVSFTETIHASGTMVAAPPSQNTKIASGYIAAGYTLAPIYGNIYVSHAGGIGGSGLVIDTPAAVVNLGTVKNSAGGAGITLAAGGALTVANYGFIGATGGAGITLTAGPGTVTNRGTILGGSTGVDAGSGGPLTVANYGLIEATGGPGVALKSANDRLIVESGSTIVGGAQGGGGTLYFAYLTGDRGFATITGLGSVGTVTGVSQMTFAGFGAYAVGPHDLVAFAGNNSLASGKSLTISDAFIDPGGADVIGTLINAGTISGFAIWVQGFLENSVASALISGGVRADSAATFENFGTVSNGVEFTGTNDRLIVEAGSTIVGGASVGGGDALGATLEIGGGTGTITGVGGSAGTLTGATGLTFSGFENLVVDAGASWTVSGPSTVFLTSFGTITIATTLGFGELSVAGGRCALASGVNLTNTNVQLSGGEFVVGGGLVTSSAWKQTGGTLSIAAGATLSLAGQTLLSGPADIAGDIVGAGTLWITGSETITGAAVLTVSAIRVTGGSTWVTVDASTSSNGAWTQAGGYLSVAATATFTCKGNADSFTSTDFLGHGGIVFFGGSHILSNVFLNATGVTITNAAVTLAGTITNLTTVSASTGSLVIAASGAILTGGGSLILSDRATNRIHGATSTATLINSDNTISGAGNLGGGGMRLVNRGVVDGDQTIALTIDTGAATIGNVGVIEATGRGGVIVKSAIANTGLLQAVGGTLTLDGPVTGAGHALVNNGTLVAVGAFVEAVAFGASGGTLMLAQSQSYTGKISGFSLTGATSLDLRDIGFVNAGEATFKGTASSGVLTVSDGTHTARINLIGNYTASTFTASSDGRGGVKVVDPTPPPSPNAFVAGMASLCMRGAAAGHLSATSPPNAAPALATPLG